MQRLAVGLLLLTLAITRAADGQQHTTQIGCYDVTVGEWLPVESTRVAALPRHPSPALSADSVIYSVPPRIQLHAAPSRGFPGTKNTLRRIGDGWTGTSRTFSDVVGLLRYERPITLRSVDCESRPPVPASADKRLAREIELRGYPVLALGERVPEGAVLYDRRSSAKTLEVEPSGKWAGADTVVVRIDDNGMVFHIELRYPDGFDLSPLVEQMVAEFGSEHDRPWISSCYWHNRTTTMLVDTSKSRPRFLILDRRL